MPTKKQQRESEEATGEGCFGTYSDDDDNCNNDCPDYDDCIERTDEIEFDLADLDDDDDDSDEDETEDTDEEQEEEEEEVEFDPSSIDLSDPTTRIDALADLELDELLTVAEFYKIKITGDARKDDSEVMILIDDHFDNLQEEESEEEGEKPKPRQRKRKEKEVVDPEPEEDTPEIEGGQNDEGDGN